MYPSRNLVEYTGKQTRGNPLTVDFPVRDDVTSVLDLVPKDDLYEISKVGKRFALRELRGLGVPAAQLRLVKPYSIDHSAIVRVIMATGFTQRHQQLVVDDVVLQKMVEALSAPLPQVRREIGAEHAKRYYLRSPHCRPSLTNGMIQRIMHSLGCQPVFCLYDDRYQD